MLRLVAFTCGWALTMACTIEVKKVYAAADDSLCATLPSDSVVCWPSFADPGSLDMTGVDTLHSTTPGSGYRVAWAAKKTDGSVEVWGSRLTGADTFLTFGALSSGVVEIYTNSQAFAAKKSDGSLVLWGNQGSGIEDFVSETYSNVDTVYSHPQMLAFAIKKTDGSVEAWGPTGEFVPPGGPGDTTGVAANLASAVDFVVGTMDAFAARKLDGSVVTWGSSFAGGDSSSVSSQLTGVVAIYATQRAFAAKKSDNSVVTWGDSERGADSSGKDLSDVDIIYSTEQAFAAKKTDSSVVTWGNKFFGGDSSSVTADLASGVDFIVSTCCAFAAKKSDGTVITWGSSSQGGDSSAVSSQLTDVVAIHSTINAFAAEKSDGSVVTWGQSCCGGDSSSVDFSGGVSGIYSHPLGRAFAAKMTKGVFVWGSDDAVSVPSEVQCTQTQTTSTHTTSTATVTTTRSTLTSVTTTSTSVTTSTATATTETATETATTTNATDESSSTSDESSSTSDESSSTSDESSSTSDESSSTSDESSSTSASIEVGGCMTVSFGGGNMRALVGAYRKAIAQAANVDESMVQITATRGSICGRVRDARRLQDDQGEEVAMSFVIRFPLSMEEAATQTRNRLDTTPTAEVARLLAEEVSKVDGLGEVAVISDMITTVEIVQENQSGGNAGADGNAALVIGIVAGVLGVLALCAAGVGIYLCNKKRKDPPTVADVPDAHGPPTVADVPDAQDDDPTDVTV